MVGRRNLAEALGGWSVRHRKSAVLGWLLLVVAAAVLGGVAGQRKPTTAEMETGETGRAARILVDAGVEHPAGEMVLVHSDTLTADAAGFRTAVAALVTGLRDTGQVTGVGDPYASGMVSADRHDVLVRFDMVGDARTAGSRVQPVLAAVARTGKAHPEVSLDEFGEATAQKTFDELVGRDFRRAEWTAVPLALGILLVAFGALLAAVLPVLLAMTAFTAAFGLMVLLSHLVPMDDGASSIMLLMGLAVGVDYCLFYLRREREERAAGRDQETALRVAAATSGRSVLVSGLTVLAAMAGILLSGLLLFDGIGLAMITVVVVAMVGSVTVLPALLSILGDRVELGRIPFLHGARRRAGGGRLWAAVLGRVLARPGAFATLSVLTLLVLAMPALGMRTETLGVDQQLSPDSALVQSYHRISAAFPGRPAPALTVVRAPDIDAAPVRQAIATFTRAAQATGELGGAVSVDVHRAANVAEIQVPLAGDGSGAVSRHALHTLREQVVPSVFGKVPGVEAAVGGELASSLDFNGQLRRSIVPVFLFVTVLAFLLMLFSFRSVVVAATSIALNLLSVGAAYGVMVGLFQHGWGASVFGVHPAGAIESWIPLFVFVILFGLSMDYHVFVVSRIREAYDRGMPTRTAVLHGISSSAGVVTSAAVIMVAVFSIFGSLSMQDLKQFGLGLAVAVLLDATLVRAVLLPSVMALLGERNWYLPRTLSWLPRISHGTTGDGTDGTGATGATAAISGMGGALTPVGVGRHDAAT